MACASTGPPRNSDGRGPDDSEEVVRSGLSLTEAEELCAAKTAQLPKPAAPLSPGLKPCLEERGRHRDARQLALKF